MKVTKESELIAGALYCAFVRADFDGESDRDGELLYWTGYRFLTEDGDEAHPDCDYFVRQVGDINPEFVETAPPDSGVAYQAGYAYACGYHD